MSVPSQRRRVLDSNPSFGGAEIAVFPNHHMTRRRHAEMDEPYQNTLESVVMIGQPSIVPPFNNHTTGASHPLPPWRG